MKRQIKNVRYDLLSSPTKGVHEVVVSYTINDHEQKWVTFIKNNSKWKDQDYLKEAKVQFNQAIEKKKIKFRKNHSGVSKFLIVLTSILGVTTLGLGGLFVYQYFFANDNKQDASAISLTIDDKIYTYGQQYITCTVSSDSKQKATFVDYIIKEDIVLPDIADGRFISNLQKIDDYSIGFYIDGSANTIPTEDETPIDIVIKGHAFEESCDGHIATYFCRNRVCVCGSQSSSATQKYNDIVLYGATVKSKYLRDSGSDTPFTLNSGGEYRDGNQLIFSALSCDCSGGNSTLIIHKNGGVSLQVNRYELKNLKSGGTTASIKLYNGSTTLEGYECELGLNYGCYYFIPVSTN